MNRLLQLLKIKTDRRGVTALEYGLIAGVIVATIAVGFSLLANQLSTKFAGVGACVTDGPDAASCTGAGGGGGGGGG